MDLPIDDVSALLALVPDGPLASSSFGGKTLSVPFDRSGSVALAHPPAATTDLHSSLQIALFTSIDDHDGDGVLVVPGRDPFGGVTPALTLSADRAWLKYRADAGALASEVPAVTVVSAAVTVDGSTSAVLSDYRVHQRTERLHEALGADLKRGTRLALVLSDVESLLPGEALSVQVGSTLKLAVKVSWVDVLAGHLALLGVLTSLPVPLALELDASAAVTADVSVGDDFIVVFAAVDDRTWRVSAKKADKRTLGGGAGAGVGVTLSDPASVASVVDTLLERALGTTTEALETVLQRESATATEGDTRATATEAMRRLGLDAATATVAGLRRRVTDLRGTLIDGVTQLAETKIAAAFTYEYQRVTTSSHVLQATLALDALRAYHGALSRGDFQPLIAALLADRPDVSLEQYLHEQSIERTRSWGFTLGIGKFLSIGGTDTRTVMPVVRETIDGQRQESYLGLRQYDGGDSAGRATWSGQFSAAMRGFNLSPTLSQFDVGIHLLCRQQSRRLSEDDVDRFLDAATIWAAVTPDQVSTLRRMLVEHVGRSCDATVQLLVADTAGQPTLRRVLAGAASAPAIASALGEAMPWRAGTVGRTSVAVRRNLYAPLWQAYLDAPQTSPESLAATASHHLDGQFGDLARLERDYRDSRPDTFAGLAELDANTPACAAAFTNGMETLRRAIDADAPSQPTVQTVFDTLAMFWEQSLHVRAAGVHLLDAARAAGIFDQVQRTATFEVDGKAVVIG
jgi:hypothetical protein